MGQRIAQKRKELGLSQEGLGERLGVSRQTVYKWESDAALPEIEKLVNLSREFSVSVDWLLGQEDETREPQELTPEQLRMVEEIVGRYLDARSVERVEDVPSEDEEEAPKKKRRWLWVLGAVAVIVLVGVFSNLFTRLDRLYNDTQNLQMNVGEIRYDVNNQIYSITRRVEEVLQSQNTLTAEQSAEVAHTDYRANTVTVSARALPRTYVEGMTAEFILASDGETVTVPGALGDNHAFTAELTGPLSDDIVVSVAFLTGDQRQTQPLDQFFGLYTASFPDIMLTDDLWGSNDQVGEYMSIHISQEDAEKISSIRVGLFRDRKLLAWYEHLDEKPSNYTGDWSDHEFFRLDGEYTMEPDHEYCQVAVVVDQYGRERVYPSMSVVYDPVEKFAKHTSDTWEWYGDPAGWDY